MSKRPMLGPLFVLVLSMAASCAFGQQLQSFRDCVVGKRVSTNDGRKGTITRLDQAWSYCYVRFDDNGKEVSERFSVRAKPSWPTTLAISNKSPTGFTISFATPAPEGATVDWAVVGR